MSDYTIFPNTPITEAILDIRAELPKEVDLEKLATFQDAIIERYPEKQERVAFEAGFQLKPEGPTALPTSAQSIGYLFRSSVENKIVQVRKDGFTFNKLRPYEDWEQFKSEAIKLWDLYFQLAKPVKITRIALRYINRIELPLPFDDFKEYILTTPEIAPSLPQALEHFFMQLIIPNPEIQAKAIITQTMEKPTENQILPLIFDIDVYREVNYGGNLQEMWVEFEKLRAYKDDIFFNNLTDKTKELFK